MTFTLNNADVTSESTTDALEDAPNTDGGMTSDALAEFLVMCSEVASKLLAGEKVTGWQLGSAGISMEYDEADPKTIRYITLNAASRAKVHGDAYASFDATCKPNGKCSVGYARFFGKKRVPRGEMVY
jgi:hypothetical protein